MKTNVKNGLIFLGEFVTETATIRIGEIRQLDFKFVTMTDGWYPVLGETNDNGVVERIIIEVEPGNLFDNDEITEIDLDDVIGGTVNGEEIE
jgi:hypothetical protein